MSNDTDFLTGLAFLAPANSSDLVLSKSINLLKRMVYFRVHVRRILVSLCMKILFVLLFYAPVFWAGSLFIDVVNWWVV